MRIRVGFRFVVELDGDDVLLFFFLGSTSLIGLTEGNSMRVVVRRKEFIEVAGVNVISMISGYDQ